MVHLMKTVASFLAWKFVWSGFVKERKKRKCRFTVFHFFFQFGVILNRNMDVSRFNSL